MKVLLIEDDPAITEVIRWGLEDAHYRVSTASDGNYGLALASEQDFNVILLDLMLPGRDGLEVCRLLRARRCSTPILMLTARDTPRDRVVGLDQGADDYLSKPFDFPELLARIRALTRRDKAHRARLFQIGDLTVDTGARRVLRGQQEIALTDREFTLLEALAQREGQTLTRSYILQSVWDEPESYSNLVDVYVRLLRDKLDRPPFPKLIHTIHGVGYSLRGPVADSKAASV